MTTVQEIKIAIEALPHVEFMNLIQWIHKKDWKEWDRQLEMDIKEGKLNFLIEEAMEEKEKGTLKEL